MRKLILLLVSLFILVDMPPPIRAEQASGVTDTTVSSPRAKSCGESFSRNSTEEFNTKCVALAGSRAAMRDEVLVIRMDDGSRKTFDNKNSDGATAGAFGYGLADFYPTTHIFVVCDFGPDNGKSLAIDGRTGRQTDFGDSFPQFSPDGNWVLAIDYGGEDSDSKFSILDVRSDKPLKIWSSEKSKPRLPPKAEFVAWIDNKTIRFKSAGHKLAFLIQAEDGSWRVGPSPGN